MGSRLTYMTVAQGEVSPSKRNMHWRDRSFDKKQRVLPLPDLGSFITGVIFIADGLTNNAVNAILPQ